MNKVILRCYAEGKRGKWEAVCLDLDIAVQGDSLPTVFEDLHKAIEEYVAYVITLPASERDRLLHRKAPWWMRLKFAWHALLIAFSGDHDSNGKERAEFTLNANLARA